MRKGLRFTGAALLLCGALSFLGGCAAGRSAPGATARTGESAAPAHVIPGVPFLPQEEDSCGPSSLAMLLRFHGKDATTDELVRETRTVGLRGALITDLAAAARRRGVAAEVVDLRVLRPLDMATVLASVAKTHRAIVIDEAWRTGSLAAEVSAQVMEGAFYDLDRPVARVCSAEVPIPYAKHLEDAALPRVDTVVATARAMLCRDG